jgi:methylated-DNA-[protein]-cysteine S-methyltransferase
MNSPVGLIKLGSDEWRLKSVSFGAGEIDFNPDIPDILSIARKQLEEYFSGSRRQFTIPVEPDGSAFQHQVWEQVTAVNYGFTKSYGEIARALGSAKFSRAVGMANGKNPLPIIIPCHRIIAQSGKLTGYAGGLERKKWLLLHEQHDSGSGRLFQMTNNYSD